jgi:WD40 repeat protein
MVRRFYFLSAALLALSVAACGEKKSTTGNGNNAGDGIVVETGRVLYDAPYRKVKIESSERDPITVPLAHAVILHKLDIPSRVDGTISWVGIQTDETTAAKLSPRDVFRHPRDKMRVFQRLKPGMMVPRDGVVALLDDEQASIDFLGADTKAKAAEKEYAAYAATVKTLQHVVELQTPGYNKGNVAPQEYLSYIANASRYEADAVNRQGSAEVAKAEAKKAKFILDKHTLLATISGEVQQVMKHEGDGVKATEPILTIHNLDELRIEGNLPKQYMDVVQNGDKVIIEGPRIVPALRTFTQHTTNKAITAIAVGMASRKPVIISGGEDGWVHVWNASQKVDASWKQSTGVTSLAVTRPEADSAKVFVGCESGSAKIYDLDNTEAAPKELDGKHDGGVSAAAFSPDGAYLVTANDRQIHLWNTKDGTKKYTFPARVHHSPITALYFNQQGHVISIGKEPSVRVWLVGDKNASVVPELSIDSRTGDVATLAVTDDGSRLLLDADKSRLDVIHLEKGRKERPLVAADAIRFQTFAQWSPEIGGKEDNRLIATTGTDGVVQLWKAPTVADRGYEFAQLICNGTATCAAFSPVAEKGFVVVGTKKGEIHVWDMPTADELKNELEATVTQVSKVIDSNGRTVPIVVHFENPIRDGKHALRPGSLVTLVIKPKK